jgi:hypothetical protein
MLRSARRLDVAACWQRAREQFAAVVAERDSLKVELDWTKQALAQTLEALRELRAAVLARQKAEAELAALYRERAIARARTAQRDPAAPLN